MGLNMADFGSFGYVKMTGDTPENIDPLADDTSHGERNTLKCVHTDPNIGKDTIISNKLR